MSDINLNVNSIDHCQLIDASEILIDDSEIEPTMRSITVVRGGALLLPDGCSVVPHAWPVCAVAA
jgi:hypothetical protein